MDTDALAHLDRSHLWHPFTQQRGWEQEAPVMIERGEGSMLYDTDGNAYIDGVSSLWCTVHGHRHPVIDAAVRAQLDRVAHSTMLGLSHPGAARLAARLVEIAPEGLTRVFYSDNGSTAAEVAVKMAYQHWQLRGETARTEFICLGDAAHMRALLEAHGERVAAVVVEPLVQGAAGMIVHPEGYLRAVRELCDEFGVLLICDEVAVGFGRTGTMFACQQEDVAPDIMCVAKGVTGGYLPLAATLTTESVYDAFLGEHHEYKTFFHGHTYTGNPLACAAALATLDVFESERTLERLAPKIALLGELLDELVAPLPTVAEIRRRGFMTGIELISFPVEARMGHQVTLAARARGAIVRPLGDVVVLMPPLSITEDELTRLVGITAAAIEEATGVGAPRMAA
jgi:adenosylmethionine-8-amino-7-oxononanoate aminotransferase